MQDLWRLSATELGGLIKSKKVSAKEAATAALARLDAVNPKINAVVDHKPAEVLAEAAAIDAKIARGEDPGVLELPDESAVALARRLIDPGSSPTSRLAREELHGRVRAALAELGERDREVLVMRYVEGLSNADIAASLGLGEGAVKMRHLRALERLRGLLADEGEGRP